MFAARLDAWGLAAEPSLQGARQESCGERAAAGGWEEPGCWDTGAGAALGHLLNFSKTDLIFLKNRNNTTTYLPGVSVRIKRANAKR